MLSPHRFGRRVGQVTEVTEENKALLRRYTDEVVNKGNLDAADEMVAPGYVHHQPPNPDQHGIDRFKQLVVDLRTAFPDIHVAIDDQIAEGDRVATRITIRGTHLGEFLGVAPTGRKVEMKGIAIDRCSDGKIVEGWECSDALGLMRQLGAVP